MEKYEETATATSPKKIRVETPYDAYEFDTEEEAQAFLDYVNADPDYDDPDLGDIVEWLYFYQKEEGIL